MDPGIQSALPDWAGRIWFVTQSGVVGFVTPGGAVHSVHLPAAETIANSFAMDESGGVFVVSTHALYRYDVVGGVPHVTWRKAYDRGTRQKPGQVSQGSGTTPTLIGSASSPGGGSIAITDNADPRMNVLVFRRGKAGPGSAPLCRQPVFPAGQGSDENSLIAVPDGVVAENNYGYAGPKPAGTSTRTADTTPGLVKVAVDFAKGGCHVAWSNTTARVPTVVSKLSRGSGLIYGYTHPVGVGDPDDRAAPRGPGPGRVVLHRLRRTHRPPGLVALHRQRAGLQQQLRARDDRAGRLGVRRLARRPAPHRRRGLIPTVDDTSRQAPGTG